VDTTDLATLVSQLPQTISDLESEVAAAKWWAIGSSVLLAYIAFQVSRPGRRR
jgi:hypothetical protein